jgi:hypothetical protein
MRRVVIAVLSCVAVAVCPSASNAKVLLGAPAVISDPAGSGGPITGLDAAYDSSHDRYLIAWTGEQGVFGSLLDGSGRPLSRQFYIGERSNVRVVHGPPGEFLVLSAERGPAGTGRLVVRRLGTSGQTLAGPFTVTEELPARAELAYNRIRQEYLVAWATDRIVIQRLGREGHRVGASRFVSATGQALGSPVAAHNPRRDEYLVAWDQQEGASWQERRVRAQRLDGEGSEIGADDFPVPAVPDTLGPTGEGLPRWVWVEDLEHDPAADRYLLLRTYSGTAIDGRVIDGAGTLGGAAPPPTNRRNGCCGEYIVNSPRASFDTRESRFYWAWPEDLDGSTWLVDTEVFAGPLDGEKQVSSFGRGHSPARDAGAAAIVYNPRADQHLVVFSATRDTVFARRIGNAPDRRAPVVSVRARRGQHVLRRRGVRLRVRCDEPCRFVASGRPSGFVRRQGSLPANKWTSFKLKLRRGRASPMRRILSRRRSARLRLTVVATDPAGNRATVKRTIRATR